MSGQSTSAAITSSQAVNKKPQLLDCCPLMFVRAEVFAGTRFTPEVNTSGWFPARHRNVPEETGLKSGLCTGSYFTVSRNILCLSYRTFIESLLTFFFYPLVWWSAWRHQSVSVLHKGWCPAEGPEVDWFRIKALAMCSVTSLLLRPQVGRFMWTQTLLQHKLLCPVCSEAARYTMTVNGWWDDQDVRCCAVSSL